MPSVLSALSSLPAPIRLPLGPEPVAPLLAVAQDLEQDSSELSAYPLLLPPGLTLARAASLAGEDAGFIAKPAGSPRPLALGLQEKTSFMEESAALANDEASQGITVGPIEVNGMQCARAEWKIEDLRGKLQASMGRPLVSPPFAARGLPNLRLMVFPDAKEAVKGVRSRERKGLYAAMVRKGPLHGALRLKADCLEFDTVLRFYLTVGSVRQGPFTYDFSERAIHGCDDFGTDWLKQVDETTGNLNVGVEILGVEGAVACMGDSDTVFGWPQDMYSPALVETTALKGDNYFDQSTGRARGKRGGASQSRLRAC